MTISTSKKAGRPARLSRDMILQAAMQLIEEQGLAKLSIRRLAQKINTVPANLYTYFADKQALLDQLGEQVFSDFRVELNSRLPWDEQIEGWMEQVHERLLSNQDLIFLMGVAGTTTESLATIKSISVLLQEQGMAQQDAVLHAQSLLWNVLSFSLFECQAGAPDMVEKLQSAGNESTYPEVVTHLAVAHLSPLWQSNLRRSLDGIRYQLEVLNA